MASCIGRRKFLTTLGGAAAAWPLAARGQQTTKSRKVGLLHPGESTTVNMRVAAIREGLNGTDNQRDLSFEIIVRLADGDVSRLPALATDLVNNRVDAIVAAAPAAVQAAAGATTSIPVIAIDLESDPVASGFVRSLARPGGNVTGVFLDFPDFAKCLQLLIETVPTLSGVGLLWDPSTGVLQLKARSKPQRRHLGSARRCSRRGVRPISQRRSMRSTARASRVYCCCRRR
jgi:putative tryptophan/tyrosine transport system substrate-binding protein